MNGLILVLSRYEPPDVLRAQSDRNQIAIRAQSEAIQSRPESLTHLRAHLEAWIVAREFELQMVAQLELDRARDGAPERLDAVGPHLMKRQSQSAITCNQVHSELPIPRRAP